MHYIVIYCALRVRLFDAGVHYIVLYSGSNAVGFFRKVGLRIGIAVIFCFFLLFLRLETTEIRWMNINSSAIRCPDHRSVQAPLHRLGRVSPGSLTYHVNAYLIQFVCANQVGFTDSSRIDLGEDLISPRVEVRFLNFAGSILSASIVVLVFSCSRFTCSLRRCPPFCRWSATTVECLALKECRRA